MSIFCRAFNRSCPALKSRNFHKTTSSLKWKNDSVDRFFYNLDGYRRLGLMHDDNYNPEECMLVAEAVRRLPEDLQMQRIYRGIRAHQLTINNAILPKEEWTKFEDERHFYLEPYLEEVKKEYEEMQEWEANH